MDGEGYVPLIIIGRFNRVRALTQDVTLIKEALEESVLLETREERVRRRGTWTQWLPGGDVISLDQVNISTLIFMQAIDVDLNIYYIN